MRMEFKGLNGATYDPAKMNFYTEDDVWFIRTAIHPVLDGMNTGYNFALRSNPVDDSDKFEVRGGDQVVKARLIGETLPGWGDMDFPSYHYSPLPLIREIVFRLKKNGVVFFEEERQSENGKLASFISENINRNPQMFVDPFGGATVVLDDLYRPDKDVTVRFFPKL